QFVASLSHVFMLADTPAGWSHFSRSLFFVPGEVLIKGFEMKSGSIIEKDHEASLDANPFLRRVVGSIFAVVGDESDRSSLSAV
ncbi:MAG: hypothetical protein NTV22_12960, partial [bacterium]|nr:hypothetical protein [bacterium]